MTDLIIKPKPITKENFKKFGDMITTTDIKPIEINNGYAKRYDGIANLNTKKDCFNQPTKSKKLKISSESLVEERKILKQ